MRKLAVVITAALLTACASTVELAQENAPNILNKTFDVSEAVVVSPNQLELTTNFNGLTDNATLVFEVPYVDFADDAGAECTGKVMSICQRLTQYIDEKRIQVNLKGYDRDADTFTGEFFVDGHDLVFHMIENGWYEYDYRQSRMKYLVILQKRAKCSGLGIWQNKQSSLTDLECN